MAKSRVTIVDVARTADVSVATVSRVINGVSTVDPDLARRVRVAIEATGYVPDRTGRALRRQVLDVWAVIVPDVQNPFFTEIMAGVEAVAESRGLSVMMCNTDENVARERRYLAAAVAQRMAGVVIAVTSEKSSDLSVLQQGGVPVVLVDRRTAQFETDMVILDNRHAGELVAKHLVEQGAHRIACITGPTHVTTTQDRYLGLLDTLARLGVPKSDTILSRADLHVGGGYRAMCQLLDRTDPPDAVFVTNGPMTAGAYRALQERQVRLPDEIALVGVDDDRWMRMVTPAVSVISQPVTEMGRTAAELLARRATHPDTPPVRLALAPSLAIRGSSLRKP